MLRQNNRRDAAGAIEIFPNLRLIGLATVALATPLGIAPESWTRSELLWLAATSAKLSRSPVVGSEF